MLIAELWFEGYELLIFDAASERTHGNLQCGEQF